MKKCIYLLIIFLVASAKGYCQGDKIELIGTLELEDKQIISLKLSFEVLENGLIKGTSITDFYGENRTVSQIEGTLDVDSQLLTFKETANLSTKSNASANEFCYIEVRNLSIRQKNEQSILNGTFSGAFPNGEACAKGYIYVVGANILESLAEAEDSAVVAEEANAESQEKNAQKIRRAVNPNATLKGGEEMNLIWQSNTVRIDIWDSYQEDNDRINIYVNGKLLHASIEVKERKKSFSFDFISGESLSIRIEAENEGTNPPNTVNAQLIDNGLTQPLVTRLKKNQSVVINIKR